MREIRGKKCYYVVLSCYKMLLGYISNHLRMLVQKSLWKNEIKIFFLGYQFFEDFHQNFWLQSTLKNLICAIYQHFNMSKDASRCGQSIARWIKSIRPVHPKIFLKVASPPLRRGSGGEPPLAQNSPAKFKLAKN